MEEKQKTKEQRMNELAKMHQRTTEAGAQEEDRRSRPTRRWLIGHKLTVASVLMILLTLLSGVVGLWQVLTIGQVINEAHQKEQQLTWSLDLLVAGHSLVGALDHMLVTQDSLLTSTDVPTSLGILRFYMETLQETGGEAETSDSLEKMQVAYNELLQAVHEVDLLARQELWMEAGVVLEQEVRPANEQMGRLIQSLVRQADRDVEAMAARTQVAVRQAALLLVVLVVLTTAIALGWRQTVFQEMTHSITELRQGVARISSGDLEYKLDVRTGDEIEELGDEFNKMAAKLADVIGSLEQRVAERTQALAYRSLQLETAAQISEAVSSILEPDELERQVVELIRQRFDYYYVGLFLVDESSELGRWAVLRAGTGEAGRHMLEQGHKLEIGSTSMISWCIANKQARIALDVTSTSLRAEPQAGGSVEPGEEVTRFDNPLLPKTRSELALPLISRGQAIGALTIQSSQKATFSEEDIAVLQTMANQLANAIATAQLYDQAQREIAERKRAEEAIKEYSERLEEMVEERTQKLQEAQEELIRKEKLAVLGQLAGGVSHELRNPLGAIKNAAYFLNMVLEDPEPEVKETLEILDKEVATSESVISSLLDFARTKRPAWRKVDLSAVIQETLSRVAVPGNIKVVSQLDGKLPTMLADPDQLAQVFGNIILNAVQAMPEGGRLVVKSEVPSPDWVAVSIADTGVGIPEENLGKLFEPLFTTKAKGVGLGLAVTKTLVEGHGGTIGVESEMGIGTTFTVRLPMPA
jgi:signal transduction histidine kinase